MPIVSTEQEEYLKTQIRSFIAARSKITSRQVGEALGIDKDYANKLIREVYAEAKLELDQGQVKEEITKTKLKFSLMNDRLFEIILNNKLKIVDKGQKDEEGKEKELELEVEVPLAAKMHAMEQIRANEASLMKILLDTGIFKKQIGELSVIDNTTGKIDMLGLYNLILERVDDATRELIINITNEYVSGQSGLTESNLEKQPKTI